MQALMYLSWRLAVNNLKRLARHPLRGVILVLSPLLFAVVLLGSAWLSAESPSPPSALALEELTALFLLIHANLLWGTLAPAQVMSPGFTLADVHFLFPAPLRRTTVFFYLLLFRGGGSSLWMLLIIVLLLISICSDLIVLAIRGTVARHTWALLAYLLMYLLASVATLTLGMVLTERQMQKRGFLKSLRIAIIGILGVMGARFGWEFYQAQRGGETPLQSAVYLVLHDPWLAIPLFPLRTLAEASLAFSKGWSVYIPLGFLTWGSIALLAGAYLWRRQHRLYDLGTQIATLAASYQWRRQFAPFGRLLALPGGQQRSRSPLWFRWCPQGAWSLLWGNLLILLRGGGYLVTSLGILFIAAAGLAAAQLLTSDGYTVSMLFAVMLQHATSLFALTVLQAWFPNALRRADLTRSFPFASWQIVLSEIAPAAILLSLFHIAYCLVCAVMAPTQLKGFTASCLLGLSLAPSLCMVAMWLAVLYPDPTDHIQRSIASLLVVPAALSVTVPTLVTFVVLTLLLGLSLWSTVFCTITLNAGLTWLLLRRLAWRYARFTLSDGA